MDSISEEAIRTITAFDPQALANTAWAFARCGLTNRALLTAIASQAIKLISDDAFADQNLVNTAWAIATLGS